jgi:curved DNA-binding protein
MLKIPPNTTKSRTMRLKGKGIPGNPPGDLHAVLRIELPPANTDKAKEIYQQMERDMPFDPRAGLGV